MDKTVVVIGTCDTKGPEIAYLRDLLLDLELRVTVVDAGILGEPVGITPDIDAAQAARHGGTTLQALRTAGSRGKAVAGMRSALAGLTPALWRAGRLDAVVGLGGAEGAVMGAAAMTALPLGVPKVLVTPIASGRHEFGPLVGTRDVMVVHSVVDILGLNRIATTVFDNVAAAVAGLAAHGHGLPPPGPDDRMVALTMLGNTTTAAMAARERLADHGYDTVVFHSNGVGGPAMEELAEAGQFVAVLDLTTNEVNDPMVGGIHDGGPDRLRRVGAAGLPQVVVPGCIDFSVFASGSVPPALAGRPVYDHNPEFTLVRTSPAEMVELGHRFADRLADARGPVAVLVPTAGLSIPNVPGGLFWDPDADAAFLATLRAELRSDIPVTTLDAHVNDPDFGRAAADALLALLCDDARTPS